MAVGSGVADSGVACQRFEIVDGTFVWAIYQRSLHATVLVTELNF